MSQHTSNKFNVTDMFTNTKYTKNIEHGTTRNEIHRITDGVMAK